MARRIGPKRKYLKKFGLIPAGNSGKKRIRKPKSKSLYGSRLEEKQKLKFMYGIMEAQLRNYAKQAFALPGDPGINLLTKLETRLDNVVFSLNFASTITHARQLVSHRHVLVNEKKINIPSYPVTPGEIISLDKKTAAKINLEKEKLVPAWLERKNASGMVIRFPEPDELKNKGIEVSRVMELFSKLK